VLAVVVLGTVLLFDRFLVVQLVHLACAGIAQGLQRDPATYAKIYSDARALSFFEWALLASGLVALDLFCLWQLISGWKLGTRRRAVVLAMLGVSLALTAIHPVWLATRGLKGISPFYAEIYPVGPINRWFLGVVFAAVFVTAASRRMIASGKTPAGDTGMNWRRRSAAYFHENRLLALFVAATIASMEVRRLMPIASGGLTAFGPRSWTDILQEVVYWSLTDSVSQLWLLVFCLAIYRAMFGVKRKPESLGSAPRELSLSLYAIVWAALLAIVLMAAPITAALGFGICLNWWRLPF
jgi:hypothetical protein